MLRSFRRALPTFCLASSFICGGMGGWDRERVSQVRRKGLASSASDHAGP